MRVHWFCVSSVAALLFSGCGGGDPSLFVGLYDGTYDWSRDLGAAGTADFRVDGQLRVALRGDSGGVIVSPAVCGSWNDDITDFGSFDSPDGLYMQPVSDSELELESDLISFGKLCSLFQGDGFSGDTYTAELEPNDIVATLSADGRFTLQFTDFLESDAGDAGLLRVDFSGYR